MKMLVDSKFIEKLHSLEAPTTKIGDKEYWVIEAPKGFKRAMDHIAEDEIEERRRIS